MSSRVTRSATRLAEGSSSAAATPTPGPNPPAQTPTKSRKRKAPDPDPSPNNASGKPVKHSGSRSKKAKVSAEPPSPPKASKPQRSKQSKGMAKPGYEVSSSVLATMLTHLSVHPQATPVSKKSLHHRHPRRLVGNLRVVERKLVKVRRILRHIYRTLKIYQIRTHQQYPHHPLQSEQRRMLRRNQKRL